MKKPEARSQKSEVGSRKRDATSFRYGFFWLLTSGFCLLCSVLVLGCGKAKTTTVNKSKLPADLASRFDAARAWRDMERVVGFGSRPSGSDALAHTQAYIMEQLRAASLQAEEQAFTTNTPRGPITFRNIIARTRPNCPPRFIIGGHYDTKWLPRTKFVGANDGGSSTAALLEIARVLAGQPVDAWIVWFDGEEAVQQYSDKDGLYGSVHMTRALFAQKQLRDIQAVIVLDMVGDKRLQLTVPEPARPKETVPNRWSAPLVQQAFAAAATLGLRDYITLLNHPMLDDHSPFDWNRVPAIDLIDFDYGNIPRDNNFWHTERDTLDKCAPESLRIAGQIALELLRRLDFLKRPAK
ncbi:MAG: M28 family peptidase [Verrucomicrobiia bacterium]|jgi:Zn-dependent M28 family amino/carboxypeptidase